mmetsp:Transcript_33793/g.56751  ORF Transcript_33793/g.56751 Transcript_33793/m.56751 type:complete len:87 (+) Transcript_33793:62-322(+)
MFRVEFVQDRLLGLLFAADFLIGTTTTFLLELDLLSFDRQRVRCDLNFLLQQTACDSNQFKTNFEKLDTRPTGVLNSVFRKLSVNR